MAGCDNLIISLRSVGSQQAERTMSWLYHLATAPRGSHHPQRQEGTRSTSAPRLPRSGLLLDALHESYAGTCLLGERLFVILDLVVAAEVPQNTVLSSWSAGVM